MQRIFALALGTAFAAQACPHEGRRDDAVTLARMVDLREQVGVYAMAHGRAPESLVDLCARVPAGRCDWLEAERGFPDGWGTPLEYRLTETGPELRSAGKDRSLRTADDLVFTAETEHQRLLRSAGCYTLTLPSARYTIAVRLDTASSKPGWHRLRRSARDMDGEWSAAADLIYLRIIAAPHVSFVALPVGHDTVMGYGTVGGAMRDVVAVRIGCVSP